MTAAEGSFSLRPDGVAVVRCDAGLDDLVGALDAALAAREVRAIVVVVPGADAPFAQGPSAFPTLRAGQSWCRRTHVIATKIAFASKAIVAAIGGPILGDALGLALACHRRVWRDDALTVVSFGDLFLGRVPAWGVAARIADRVGFENALDLWVNGVMWRPGDAARIGLVDRFADPSAWIEEAAASALAAAGSLVAIGAAGAGSIGGIGAAGGRRVFRARASARAKHTAHKAFGDHHRAPRRFVDVLVAWAEDGADAAADVEAAAFAEAMVSSNARELGFVMRASAAIDRRRGLDVAVICRRVREVFIDEAARLVEEGVPAPFVDSALEGWGWSLGPLRSKQIHVINTVAVIPPERFAERARAWPNVVARRDGPVPVEEVAWRVSLAAMNEALRCLDAGHVASAIDLDLALIWGLGFPLFRGGPCRAIDAIGPAEVLRRMDVYTRAFGARWAPADCLARLARENGRFYGSPGAAPGALSIVSS